MSAARKQTTGSRSAHERVRDLAQKCEEMRKYPEHERMASIRDEKQKLGVFLEWLESDGRLIAVRHEHTEDCDAPRKGRDEIGRDCGMMAADALTFALPPYYRWQPPGHGERIERILALYFGIDMNKVLSEKDAMVRALQGDDR